MEILELQCPANITYTNDTYGVITIKTMSLGERFLFGLAVVTTLVLLQRWCSTRRVINRNVIKTRQEQTIPKNIVNIKPKPYVSLSCIPLFRYDTIAR